ncbi:MAG: DNA methylase [Candidatus Gerdarchaeota archaeon]|nr:MAG: DNA methylase [Candidatus Gerdarchaeota archaeon]
MMAVTGKDFSTFKQANKKVVIDDVEIEIGAYKKITELQPKDFALEITNVWSFPKRGKWATHYLNAKYRGNWAPQVPRNLILRYSKEGEIVLDPFVGSGTTLIECKLTNRRGIGIDINREAVMLALDRLDFETLHDDYLEQKVFQGDARNLNFLTDESIDLIVTHPPYANIIGYSKLSKKEGDLSKVSSIDEFCEEMTKVAKEFFRVLKPGRYCAILIGDTRRQKHQVLISFRVMEKFLEVGFALKEDIIKIQHNTKTEHLWRKQSIKSNFLLLAYEHLFIFRKPEAKETERRVRESKKWW